MAGIAARAPALTFEPSRCSCLPVAQMPRAARRDPSDVALTAEAAESTLTDMGSLLDSVDFSE